MEGGEEYKSVETEGEEISRVWPFLDQWDGAHLPIIVEGNGGQEKPKVECRQIGKGPKPVDKISFRKL